MRHICGLTQKRLAKELGMTQTHISQVELGEWNAGPHMLKKIQDIYGISPLVITLLSINVESDLTLEEGRLFNVLFPKFNENCLSLITRKDV